MFNPFIYIAASVIAIFTAILFMLWRHKKAGTGEVNLVGALASVEKSLSPEGAVIVRGELWRARLKHSNDAAEADAVEVNANRHLVVERGSSVRIVGASDYLLEVKLAD